jgi:S1/P1 Nuclease
MKITTSICGLLLAFAASTPAVAWEYQGHQMVGAIADQLLKDNAKQKVKKFLEFSLQVAAPWPDCVRSVVHKADDNRFNLSFSYLPPPLHPSYRDPCTQFETKVGSPEPSRPSPEQERMEDYAKRNWYNCTYIIGTPGGCHQAFHFADVSILKDGYDRRYVGTSDHDVVSAINACIAVLQGRPAPSPFSIKDEKEALFLLAHFVGDIHQPLHVGAIYLDSNGMRVDPDAIGLHADNETHGGNSIDIKIGQPNLHAEWDAIPKEWVTPDAAMVKEAGDLQPTSGPINGWAAIWASEAVKEAQAAFEGLTFSLRPKDPNHPDALPRWFVHFDSKYFANKEAYDEKAKETKRHQLAKGGARLAQLLNAIWP